MRLQKLRLSHFKGMAALEIEPAGSPLDVYGDNATGKTTIADAMSWLLFGKDSLGRADFEIKTLENGEPKHRLNHEVEGEFLIEGKSLTLRRSYHEDWVTTRGQSVSELSGHTTDYWLDGVPVKKKEYDAAIAGICSEDRFRVLTDPYHFAERMSWQDRRQMLLSVCGDVSDADVIGSSPGLAELGIILGARTVDQHRKVLTARKSEVAKELDRVPVRIDEIERMVSAVPDSVDEDALRKRVHDLREEIALVKAGGGESAATISLREAEAARLEVETRLKAEHARSVEVQVAAVREAKGLLDEAQDAVDRLARDITIERTTLTRVSADRDRKRAEYESVSAQVWAGSESCSACGQALPIERVESARAAFNATRANSLERLNTEGKGLKAECAALEAKISHYLEREAVANEALTKALAIWEEMRDTVAKGSALSLGGPEWDAADEKVKACESALVDIRLNATSQLAGLSDDLRQVEIELRAAEATNAQAATRAGLVLRRTELEAEHKRLAAEADRIAKELYLCDEFVRQKVSMLTQLINARFQIARFQLFEQQVNGGIAECCEVTVGGVPYGSLNHGTRLNAGLDIIDTLSGHWGFAPPIVIDNAESVTAIRPTAGQQIRLYVSAEDAVLRFGAGVQKEKVKR